MPRHLNNIYIAFYKIHRQLLAQPLYPAGTFGNDHCRIVDFLDVGQVFVQVWQTIDHGLDIFVDKPAFGNSTMHLESANGSDDNGSRFESGHVNLISMTLFSTECLPEASFCHDIVCILRAK